jgi:hypothetical protein
MVRLAYADRLSRRYLTGIVFAANIVFAAAVGIGAIPRIASGAEPKDGIETGAVFKLAMGPTSAAAKPGPPPAASGSTVTPSVEPSPKHHHRSKHRHTK